MEAQDLTRILQRSKNVMNKTKDLPYGGYVEKHGTSTLDDGSVVFNSNNNSGINESVARKSKLPIEVIEAMRNSSSTQTSVLDSIPNSLKEEITRQSPIKEVAMQQNIPSTVDYSLIKTIMEDTVKKYIGSLKKTILSEEKGSGLQLMTKKGNTFRFVTEDGKIFEGQLTYKGNINN